jgi:hypothetical protein
MKFKVVNPNVSAFANGAGNCKVVKGFVELPVGHPLATELLSSGQIMAIEEVQAIPPADETKAPAAPKNKNPKTKAPEPPVDTPDGELVESVPADDAGDEGEGAG